MQSQSLFAAGALLATIGLLYTGSSSASTGTPTPPATPVRATQPPAEPPVQDGHYALVVEGDRNGLNITHASRKTDPWAGVPKGFDSSWRLIVRDANDQVLAEVPLDVSPFATGQGQVGQPVSVQGCIVRDARIGMLVNVPRFAAAASYRLQRPGATGEPVVIGTVAGDQVRELAGDRR